MTKYEELAIQSAKAVEHQADWLERLVPELVEQIARDTDGAPDKRVEVAIGNVAA